MSKHIKVSIEVLSIEDYDAIRALWQSDAGIELTVSDEKTNVARYLRRNPNMSFVARHGDEIIGTIMSGHDGFRGYLYHLYVAPAFRGCGVARRLVAASSEALKREGIAVLRVFVLKDNVVGNDFWRRQHWDEREHVRIYGYTEMPTTE